LQCGFGHKTPLIVQAKGKMVNIPFPRVQEEKPWVMSESHLAGGVKAVKKSGNTMKGRKAYSIQRNFVTLF